MRAESFVRVDLVCHLIEHCCMTNSTFFYSHSLIMAAINRQLPAHSESHDRIPNIRPNSGMASSMQQDPGQHSTAQDPGFPPHPQHPIFARPVVYIHAPPPPPLLHYQWPMPFSYNPFAGFPSMGKLLF